MKKISSLLAIIAIAAPALCFAADTSTASQQQKTAAKAEIAIKHLKSTLDEKFGAVFKAAHADIIGKHQVVTWEKSGDKTGDKTCVLTKLGDHQYLAYVPDGSISGISAIDYRWVPRAGLLVMPLDKSGSDMKSAAYFDFLLTGFDPKIVSEHVTTASSSGAISVPLRTALLSIGDPMLKVSMLKPDAK